MRRVTNTNLFSSKALAELLHQENIPLRPQPDSKSPGAVEPVGGLGGRHYDLAQAKIILGFWVQKLHNAN